MVSSLSKTALLSTLLLALSSPVSPSPYLQKRGLTTNADDLNGRAFDYIIVGGGAAGLALAARLTEDPNKTVAVIEAGDDGSAVMERILVPILAYLDGVSVPGSSNDWDYWSNTLGRWVHEPRGKILGGSTAVNALYMVRASAEEHDSWASLLPNAEVDWSWEGFYPYMQKSENFTAPTEAVASLTGLTVDESFHGHDGPVLTSYPQYVYPSTQLWTPTMANLGLKTTDPQGGEGWGGFLAVSSINPDDGTRSYAKTAYLDPASDRSNLFVLLQHQVTKVTFDTSGSVPRATGVDFAASSGGTTYHIECRSEVIVSGGVFGTPQLLQLSGVGPRDLLESFGIDVVSEVPGVGEHFQDHVLVTLVWSAPPGTVTGDLLTQSQFGNGSFVEEQLELFHSGQLSESLMSAPNNGIGYVSLRQLFGNDTVTAQFVQELKDNMTAVIDNQGFTDPTLRAGYEATYIAEVETLENTEVGAVELLLGSFGSWNADTPTISIQVAIQHPMSRGSVKINSTDAFENPIIMANYLNTDSDWTVMRQGVRYLRQLVATQPLSSLIVDELRPGPDVQSDADIDSFLYENAQTQYHPASTSSMLPLDKGGVVDPSLKVYGTEGLRVVDASIVPIGLCAHLMAPTYAIAEKAADIIQANPTPDREPVITYNAGSTTRSFSLATSLLILTVTGIIAGA